METYVNWTIPYRYIKRYLILMIGVLFVLPVLTGLRYTLTGYVVNYFFADLLFYRWCIPKIEDDRTKERKEKFLGKRYKEDGHN